MYSEYPGVRFSDKTLSSAVSAPYCTGPVCGLPGQLEEQAHLVCCQKIWCLRLSQDYILKASKAY